MKLYEQWENITNSFTTHEQQQVFWEGYFEQEKDIYDKILNAKRTHLEGTVADLAKEYDVEPLVFSSFIDGINTSLETEVDYKELEEDTAVVMDIVWEKLYYNMLDAKAKWLYTLPGWDDILTEDRRKELTKEWRKAGQAHSEKIVGRNDPCPCGSGKKFKKCHGQNL